MTLGGKMIGGSGGKGGRCRAEMLLPLGPKPPGKITKGRVKICSRGFRGYDAMGHKPNSFPVSLWGIAGRGKGGGGALRYTPEGDTGEIRAEVREQIDTKVAEWREEGKAEIIPGVLFIDERNYNDQSKNYRSPQGIPIDFLGTACLSSLHNRTQKKKPARSDIRTKRRDVEMSEDAKILLTKDWGFDTSLRDQHSTSGNIKASSFFNEVPTERPMKMKLLQWSHKIISIFDVTHLFFGCDRRFMHGIAADLAGIRLILVAAAGLTAGVHEVHGPLAVTDEENAGVDAGPAFLHQGEPAVDY
nr:ruvB-like 2 [Ipomoea batatas]